MSTRQIAGIVACALALAASASANAQKTYTPAQLRSMVQAGNYPKQGSTTTKSEYVDYAECISKVESLVASVRRNYPTKTIVSTNIARIEKLWTNDAAMTVSCSAPDRKLVITSAPYL